MLKHFTERILSINPAYSSMLGPGVPGMSGASSTMIGGSSNTAEVVIELRKTTAALAHKLSMHSSQSEIQALAQEVEGHILTLQTLGLIHQEFAESLITELHDLTER